MAVGPASAVVAAAVHGVWRPPGPRRGLPAVLTSEPNTSGGPTRANAAPARETCCGERYATLWARTAAAVGERWRRPGATGSGAA